MKVVFFIGLAMLAGCSQASDPGDRELRAAYADEVVAGDKSFEQAGCEYRGGDWDGDREMCSRPGLEGSPQPPATAACTNTTPGGNPRRC